ncbi:hypothetical protein Tco_0627345 [Tanacetum coccineum]|uniref:Uncharacterized protein n=1 Tax=Tanacetum coccineum TaxID=301880 RepID=A0ABQ4WM93_9ASTR
MKNFLQSSRKEILVSPHPRKATPLILSCQRNHDALTLSLINQDLLYLKEGNSGPEMIVLSLHKFLAVIFNDDDIEEQTSRWKEPGSPKEEIYSNSKIIQVIKTYWELGHEHKFITEIVERRANDCIVSITEPDYKNLNKNDIKDIYLLIMNGKVSDYVDTGLLWSLSVFIRSSVIWERVQKELTSDEVEYLKLFEEEIEEVIINGDAPAAIISASAGTKGHIPPKTAEQKLARKNELKGKKHSAARFGGNKESKKKQKTILKQQYENFAALRSEGLDKTYDRFQKLISQLEIHGEVISREDANLKLLRSLPSAWNNIVLIIRNKSDLYTLSMDDLYNNLKVYEFEFKGQSRSSLNSQNVAFVSLENTSSTNEAVNTAHDVTTASSQGQAPSLTYTDDVMFSFFVNQSNSLQLDNEDLEQIDTDDLGEMDLKWLVAMLTIRVKRFYGSFRDICMIH